MRITLRTSHLISDPKDEAAQHSVFRDDSSISSPGRNTTSTSRSTVPAYVGREHYLAHGDAIDEATIATPATEATNLADVQPLHETTVAAIKLFNGFAVPPRAIRQSLLDSFHEHCHTWTPVLEAKDLAELSQIEEAPSSMFLAQSVWMAGSRFSSSPSVAAFATTSQLYHRARALFWSSAEDDVFNAIKGSILLQWYNPQGPEKASLDNSEFWLKIGVGLAHQLGLHRAAKDGTRGQIRRRLWWTLVVGSHLLQCWTC